MPAPNVHPAPAATAGAGVAEGTYRSTQDACIRRLYYQHGGTARNPTRTLLLARTRPGQPEEPAYPFEESLLTRQLAFGLWHRID